MFSPLRHHPQKLGQLPKQRERAPRGQCLSGVGEWVAHLGLHLVLAHQEISPPQVRILVRTHPHRCLRFHVGQPRSHRSQSHHRHRIHRPPLEDCRRPPKTARKQTRESQRCLLEPCPAAGSPWVRLSLLPPPMQSVGRLVACLPQVLGQEAPRRKFAPPLPASRRPLLLFQALGAAHLPASLRFQAPWHGAHRHVSRLRPLRQRRLPFGRTHRHQRRQVVMEEERSYVKRDYLRMPVVS